MIYRLTWNAAKDKYDKKPVALDGSPLHTGGTIPTTDRATAEAAVLRLGRADHAARTDGHSLGIRPGPEDRMFFFDLDAAVVGDELTAEASRLVAPFIAAGCYFEGSSSGRGAHVLGRYHGELPTHSTRRPTVHSNELYVGDQGCVLSDAFSGSWDVDATAQLLALLADQFPMRAAGVVHALTDGPRADWRGPADDDVLIARMLAASGSAAARLGGKTSLKQLWAGDCPHDSETDMALASHLAFWTGADAVRVERLMLRSGLVRDKWYEGRRDSTYLGVTVEQACITTGSVYAEPLRVDTTSALLGARPPLRLKPPVAAVTASTDDWHTVTDTVVALINAAGTRKELYDVIMPTLNTYGFPKIYGETVVTALNRKLELFGAKQPVSVLREMVMPRAVMDATQLEAPEWAQPLIYVRHGDKFFNTVTGSEYSHEGCRMEFNRCMPMKPTGTREDCVQWLRDRWNITNVDDLEYRPDQPPIFEYSGHTFGNLFLASTMPTPVLGTDECSACIELFTLHLYDVVGRRDELYAALLGWLAHNVQYPGIKIRWSPLIKGVPGDGKSIIGDVLFATMGAANVKMTSNATLANGGGFTDWATGRAVNIIEEILLHGKERRNLYNNMKIFIGDKRIELNRKGRASGGTLVNVTNHSAYTNHNDAVPVEELERRWCVIFTPWESADAAAKIKGLDSSHQLPAYFRRLGASMEAEPGAWRAWLMGIDLSSFDPDGRAPETDERSAMQSGSEDFIEQTVRDAIERGAVGVTSTVFCSSSLMGRVQVDLAETPDKRSWNKILNHLGYKQTKPMWWMGKTRRIWVKFSMTNEKIVEILDSTKHVRSL